MCWWKRSTLPTHPTRGFLCIILTTVSVVKISAKISGSGSWSWQKSHHSKTLYKNSVDNFFYYQQNSLNCSIPEWQKFRLKIPVSASWYGSPPKSNQLYVAASRISHPSKTFRENSSPTFCAIPLRGKPTDGHTDRNVISIDGCEDVIDGNVIIQVSLPVVSVCVDAVRGCSNNVVTSEATRSLCSTAAIKCRRRRSAVRTELTGFDTRARCLVSTIVRRRITITKNNSGPRRS